MSETNLRQMRETLNQKLNSEDLHNLCFDLGIDFENLAGEGKAGKVRELVYYLNRRSQLGRLLEYLMQTRPDWAIRSAPFPLPSTPTPPASAGGVLAQEQLRRVLRRGQLTLFVGADLPCTLTGQPDRQTLADGLARYAGIPSGGTLPEVATLVMENGRRYEFTMYLREAIAAAGQQPQPIHRALVGLVQEHRLEMVFTTATDGLLESAFLDEEVIINKVINDNDLGVLLPDMPTLVKLYGDWQQPASLVVTSIDENQFVAGNLPGKRDLLDELHRALRRNAVLFVGVDLAQTAVTALFDNTIGSKFQQPAFALCAHLTPTAAASWHSNRGLTVLDEEVVPFLQGLLG
ncbi:MAG: SIR2 family protein [Anaerolineales bacterium]|nr:SIR2 family protein [Anaerolineales bacterium]